MCRYHLLLPDTATRRDLDDPATIDTVAKAVGDVGDPRAPGRPDRGGQPGHRSLGLGQLEGRPGGRAGRAGPPRSSRASPPPTRKRLGHRRPPLGHGRGACRRTGRPSCSTRPGWWWPPRTAAASWPRWPGPWPSTASTCAAPTPPARTGWPSRCSPSRWAGGRWPDSARLREDLEAVLDDRLALGDRLAAKAKDYDRPPPGDQPPARWCPRSAWTTRPRPPRRVVEVRAADEVGLLHRVTRALFDCDLDVVSARVSTIGTRGRRRLLRARRRRGQGERPGRPGRPRGGRPGRALRPAGAEPADLSRPSCPPDPPGSRGPGCPAASGRPRARQPLLSAREAPGNRIVRNWPGARVLRRRGTGNIRSDPGSEEQWGAIRHTRRVPGT